MTYPDKKINEDQSNGALMVVSKQLEAQTEAMIAHNQTLLEICKLELQDSKDSREHFYKFIDSIVTPGAALIAAVLEDNKAARAERAAEREHEKEKEKDRRDHENAQAKAGREHEAARWKAEQERHRQNK